MAIVFTGTQWYTRAGFFTATTSAFTTMAWVTCSALPANGVWQNICGMTGTICLAMNTIAGVSRWLIAHPVADILGTTTPVINTWYHLAMTRQGSDQRLYVNGSLETAGSNAEAGATGFIIGDNSGVDNADEWLGRIAAVKVWDNAVLTPDEIRREMQQVRPIRLNGYSYPLASAALDVREAQYGARILTKTGAITAAEGPAIPWALLRRRMFDMPRAAAGGATTVGARSMQWSDSPAFFRAGRAV